MTRLMALTAVRLTSADPERLATFYHGLGFALQGADAIPAAEAALLGQGGRRISLAAGGRALDIDRFEQPGRSYPDDITACDLAFQHFAMVTADAAAAWRLALALGARPISRTGPVQLPPETGSVIAAKLRDPDGHPIEFLQFPDRVVSSAVPVAGIDHSAISVADLDASLAFYADLGLSAAAGSRNHGAAQAALDGLDAPVVDVRPLLATGPGGDLGAHLELLAYRTPRGRPAAPAAPADGIATRLAWRADGDALLRDPDGHLHVLMR